MNSQFSVMLYFFHIFVRSLVIIDVVVDTKLALFRTSGSSTGSGGFRCELKANLTNMSLSPTVNVLVND